MIKALVVAAALIYALLALAAWLISDWMIFLPPRASYDTKRLPVRFTNSEDGVAIAVLHLPNPQADFTILYSHGNAEDLGLLAPWLTEIRDAGFAVLAYDYRGYGLSGGGPASAKGALLDERAAFHYATRELKIPASKLIVLGRSVGSGPAVDLAAGEPVGGLIVQSGFVSAFRVMTHIPLLPFDKFHNLRDIGKVRCPVLVIHGVNDEVIPAWHGRELHAAVQAPKQAWWVDGAGHNDLEMVAGDSYAQRLRDFAATLTAKSAAGFQAAPARP